MMENPEAHLDIAVLSHPGEKREINEDSYGVCSSLRKTDQTPIVLAIVADGIGGHQAGEVASQLTVDSIMNKLNMEQVEEPIPQLRAAVKSAGNIVSETSLRSEEYYGMGSTVAIAWVIGKKLYTAHVGDSRIYLVRNGNIRQITIDHTWVQEALRHEIITPEEAKNHPRAHVLQLAIGSQDPPEADFRLHLSDQETDLESENNQGLELMRGDKILLCSDGLTDLVEDHEIQTALLEQSPEEAAQSLVSLARARGGHDNITVAILAVPEDWAEEKKPIAVSKNLIRVILIVLILTVVTIALALNAVLGIVPWPWSADTTSSPQGTPLPPQATAELDISQPAISESPFADDAIATPEATLTPAPTNTAIPLPTVGTSDPGEGTDTGDNANPGGSSNPTATESATSNSPPTATNTATLSPTELLTYIPTIPLPTIGTPDF